MSERIRKPPESGPEEEYPERDEGTLALISIEDYYDLLMEQQEQM